MARDVFIPPNFERALEYYSADADAVLRAWQLRVPPARKAKDTKLDDLSGASEPQGIRPVDIYASGRGKMIESATKACRAAITAVGEMFEGDALDREVERIRRFFLIATGLQLDVVDLREVDVTVDEAAPVTLEDEDFPDVANF